MNTTISLTDQIGSLVTVEAPVKRIVSLVPSLTELLFELDLKNEIIGRTKFCIFPEKEVEEIPIIGGTKNVHLEKIHQLKPDLIIANKEENLKETVTELSKSYPVYTSNISTLHSANHAIEDIGQLTNRSLEAERLVANIEDNFKLTRSSEPLKTCIYLIWKDPYMTIGKDTFIREMLELAGFESIIYDFRYPEITLNELRDSSADYLLLSSEPYPFKEKHIEELQLEIPNKKIILVDGTYFSWYGSRIKYAPRYFEELRKSLGC